MRHWFSKLCRSRWRGAIVPVVLVVWLVALAPGIRYLIAYETTPGSQSAPPHTWPAAAHLTRAGNLPTLVVVLHPRCSCSKASLTELEEAAAGFDRPYDAVLLIFQPKGANYKWQQVSFYREAQAALHAQVILDDDGHVAALFGAQTSGQVLLYSAENNSGKLLFAGGVTAARGELGGNQGLESLKVALRSQLSQAATPVYGCGLFSRGSSHEEERP